jgi:hypothetical protein
LQRDKLAMQVVFPQGSWNIEMISFMLFRYLCVSTEEEAGWQHWRIFFQLGGFFKVVSVETLQSSPMRRNIPGAYAKVTERHLVRTLNQILFSNKYRTEGVWFKVCIQHIYFDQTFGWTNFFFFKIYHLMASSDTLNRPLWSDVATFVGLYNVFCLQLNH